MAGVAAIPVRIRLTLAFAVVMAAVLAAAGLFLYVRLSAALDRTIDRNLRERSSDVRALVSLHLALLIGGPLALLLSSLAGYGLASTALRAVESMRREAESVSASEPGRRLPLPPARDEIRRLGRTLNSMLDRLEAALAR